MALTTCNECGTQMSDQAYACPKCGHPVAPQTLLRQPLHDAYATPWYFTTALVIVLLLFCPLIGLIVMWVGRVWPTWVRAVVTSVYAFMFIASFFIWFLMINVASKQVGDQMQMMIEEIQNMPAPPAYDPGQYYEELERRQMQDYYYEEDYSDQVLTPAAKGAGSQVKLGLWTWANQTSPRAIRMEGSVKNNSTSAFEGLRVCVTAEDANGMLLGVGSAPLEPSILPAGGSSNFVVLIQDAQCTTDVLNISCRFEY